MKRACTHLLSLSVVVNIELTVNEACRCSGGILKAQYTHRPTPCSLSTSSDLCSLRLTFKLIKYSDSCPENQINSLKEIRIFSEWMDRKFKRRKMKDRFIPGILPSCEIFMLNSTFIFTLTGRLCWSWVIVRSHNERVDRKQVWMVGSLIIYHLYRII